MTKDDIYDHLAQVYLGKRKKTEVKDKRHYNAWLLINLAIAGIIFTSVFYGLTAFLNKQSDHLQSHVILSLHNGSVRFDYNFKEPASPTKSFVLKVPDVGIDGYDQIEFRLRGKEEGLPGVVKLVVSNDLNETSYFYVQNVGLDWQNVKVPFAEFKNISDWSSLNQVSFVLESWNVDNKKGVVLIDDINLSKLNNT